MVVGDIQTCNTSTSFFCSIGILFFCGFFAMLLSYGNVEDIKFVCFVFLSCFGLYEGEALAGLGKCSYLASLGDLGLAFRFVLFVFFAAVHFMDTGHSELHAEVLRLLDDGALEKVIGIQGLLGRPPGFRIIFHEFRNQAHGLIRHPFRMGEVLAQALGQSVGIDLVVRTRGKLFPEAAFAFEVGPFLGIGGSAHLVDELKLVCLVPSLEKTGSAEHFSDDASDAPHVDLGAVIDHAQEQFGWSVPQGDDLVGQPLHFRVPASGKAPIGDLEFAFAVDQEIRRFEIPMDDFVLVHIMDSIEELL